MSLVCENTLCAHGAQFEHFFRIITEEDIAPHLQGTNQRKTFFICKFSDRLHKAAVIGILAKVKDFR
jgi:hypothetical protein